jgi:hypothetical protein
VTAWTTEELERLGRARELRIAGRRQDGSLRDPVIIWAVRSGDDVYVRSVRGAAGAWFKGVLVRHEGWISSGGVERDVVVEDVDAADPVNDRIDEAYAEKYGAGSNSVRAITNDAARATTLRVSPKG